MHMRTTTERTGSILVVDKHSQNALHWQRMITPRVWTRNALRDLRSRLVTHADCARSSQRRKDLQGVMTQLAQVAVNGMHARKKWKDWRPAHRQTIQGHFQPRIMGGVMQSAREYIGCILFAIGRNVYFREIQIQLSLSAVHTHCRVTHLFRFCPFLLGCRNGNAHVRNVVRVAPALDRARIGDGAGPCARRLRADTRGRNEIPGMPQSGSWSHPPQGTGNPGKDRRGIARWHRYISKHLMEKLTIGRHRILLDERTVLEQQARSLSLWNSDRVCYTACNFRIMSGIIN